MNTTKATLVYFVRQATRYPWKLAGVLIVMPLTILSGSYITSLIVANVLNRLSRHDYNPNNIWASFGVDLIVYSALQIGGPIIGWRVFDFFAWRLEGKVERNIAQEIFDHLLKQSPNFHANRFGGSLVSQTSKLMSSYIRFTEATYFRTIPLITGLAFSSIVLATRAPLYSLGLVLFAILYVATAIFASRPVRKVGAEVAAAETAQTGMLADTVTNVMAIKSFASAVHEKARFARATDITYRKLLNFAHAFNKQQIIFGLLGNGVQALSLVAAVVSALAFKADLATVFLMVSYTASIANALSQFSNNGLRDYNRAIGDAADMIKVLQLEPEIQDPVRPEKVAISRGEITFEAVQFTHDGSKSPLFKKLDLKIKAGEKVGLVGHSGSGKTTLTRLLLRFSDIQRGTISIDGQNISKITQDDLRRHIAYVPQEPILFHRSLAENIGYGSPKATKKEIAGVAKLAHADEFIALLPQKYETLVGERGVKLSGGQRQRVAIARAMLKNAPILVLDEATAALDSESEALIQDALWTLMEGRTAIVVAHRLSTIQKMDRIIVLDNGNVIEQGSHKELLRLNGRYAKLWQRQSGGFIEDQP